MTVVRTRFAPSPTGYMHVGGVRTALFAWLVARQANGVFIVRLEDTDQAREVSGSDAHILESLSWLGLTPDEGPEIGGPFGPYKQSERLAHYKTWAEKLVASGRAYADPYTPAEVQAFREAAHAAKKPFLYRNHRPTDPPTWDGSQPLRFKSDPKDYTWHDEVMGELHAGEEAIDDFILMKSDGFPTYNFAHIVDDHEMQISHVIRSQEFLSSVPKFLNLYEALNIERPLLATVPFVLGLDGTKKLSKRDGAKDVLDYAREGYLPEALVNFIASLGWNDGSKQELFSVTELIEKFRLDHVQRGGAHFDEQRLLWMDGAHIRELPLDVLYQKSEGYWPPEADEADDDYKMQVLGLVQERLKYFSELPQLSLFFFTDLPLDASLIRDNKYLGTLSNDELKRLLEQAKASLETSDFSLDDLTTRLNDLLVTTSSKPGILFSLIRIATTQAAASPGLADTLAVLGKERSMQRLNQQLEAF
jgi:glutamyl-tRNA synthetase